LSRVVVGIDAHVSGAQIAAIAKIARLAGTQVQRYRMLGLRNDFACLFPVELRRPAVPENSYLIQLA